jgi:hypothetical protein
MGLDVDEVGVTTAARGKHHVLFSQRAVNWP